jgi:signal transduction histidine kinase
LDDSLRARASDLAAVVADAIPATLSGTGDDEGGQIVTPDGVVVASSLNLQRSGPLAPDPGEDVVIATRHIPALNDSFRVLSRSASGPDGRLVLHVVTAADNVTDSVAALRNSLLLLIPLTLVVLAAIIWWLAGRALRPVDAIRREVAAIGEDLERRVPVPATGDEIDRLAGTMNEMLDRIEDAATRLRRFVADASHELRSPLARMRSELEVDLTHPGEYDLEATHRSVLDEVLFLDDLLHLARSDSGSQVMRSEAVDLDDLVLAEAARLRMVGDRKVDVSGVSAGQVTGDWSQLQRAIRNLVDNARRHAATTVRFELHEWDSTVELAVVDDGPGIPPEAREWIFERFARTDKSRSRDAGGSGLGLAITRDVIEAHGGTVRVDTGFADGARMVVRLPRQGSRTG